MSEICRKSSVKQCLDCMDYQCKNLYGYIKDNSKCAKMIKNKEFDECMTEDGFLKSCSDCECQSMCSMLIRECVALLD